MGYEGRGEAVGGATQMRWGNSVPGDLQAEELADACQLFADREIEQLEQSLLR
jgi:hypothetical protein